MGFSVTVLLDLKEAFVRLILTNVRQVRVQMVPHAAME